MSLQAEADGLKAPVQDQHSTLVPRCYPPRDLTLPWASLGLAAIDEVDDCYVAQKQLLQPAQMWDWLWRDRTKAFWCRKDKPTLDLFSECIKDVCVYTENLPYSIRQDITSQQISFQIHSTSNLNEIKRRSHSDNKVSPCNCSSRHPSNIFKRSGHRAVGLFFCRAVGGGNWLQSQMVDRITMGYVRKA